jgi:predicted CXXCH cytochrome family protein
VSDTVHNLSASGPGRLRSADERQVCVFCHAPHNTGGVRPLWNREFSGASYKIYASSTLDARPGQPTGSSKLCLSCHDGTIALGSVLSRAERIRMTGGDYIPAGLTNLGTDLSDDHPVSFYYTSGLAASDGQLADPGALPAEIRLGPAGELECTACHDPHKNTFGDFLVKPNEFAGLCTSCHVMDGWAASAHRLSEASVRDASIGDWPYQTVAENACRACHRPHSAGGHERLMIAEAEEDNCLSCHDGGVAGANIRAELDKFSAHDPRLETGVHDPLEGPFIDRAHVECADCHNAHAVTAPVAPAGYQPIGATLAEMPGVTSGGAHTDRARFEYEVCYRCHGDSTTTMNRRIGRQSDVTSLRLAFLPTNPSYHPVVAAASGMDTPSLEPSIPPGSLIRCTDCHNNDAGPRAGGNGPDGPHGSNYEFMLERNYTTVDDNPESHFEYAMCYKCHRRASILSDESFPLHALHIRESRAPCSACHDPHGVSAAQGTGSDHTHLINFDTTIVRPEGTTGRISFRDEGRFAGTCTLTCHGEAHHESRYGR